MPQSEFEDFAVHRGVSPLDHRSKSLEEERLVMQWVADAKREEEESPKSTKEILAESRRLSRSVQLHANKLGIKITDVAIVKMIHDLRSISDA